MTDEQFNSIEDTAMSYEEWKSSNFYVRKGEKSRYRDALGVPQFCVDQVISYEPEGQRFLREELSKIPEEEVELYKIRKPQNNKPKPRRTNNSQHVPAMSQQIFEHLLSVEFKHHGHLVGNIEYDEGYY